MSVEIGSNVEYFLGTHGCIVKKTALVEVLAIVVPSERDLRLILTNLAILQVFCYLALNSRKPVPQWQVSASFVLFNCVGVMMTGHTLTSLLESQYILLLQIAGVDLFLRLIVRLLESSSLILPLASALVVLTESCYIPCLHWLQYVLWVETVVIVLHKLIVYIDRV